MAWTVTNIGINNTDTDLHPVTPNSAAAWWGSVETSPETIIKGANNGQAGKFRATSGKATGTTGMVAYNSPAPGIIIFFLIMMPYGTDQVNKTKCGFLKRDSTTIDSYQVKRIYEDNQFGTNAEYEYQVQDGDQTKTVKLYLDSKIEQGTVVSATFTLGYRT
ncbi:hypothetical protein F5Y19DRAFT_371304 [Xylariaceae sp. FL1651]|nr:hypothetical protein F5Y19DRAFT_371304 [Xylariaceae sp. FL1651]